MPLVLKTEPSEYSWDDLVRDKKTVWTGVKNPTAQKHMREAKEGDLVVVYHTGTERRAVGLGEISSAPGPDPKDPKAVVFEIRPQQPLAQPVGLDVIKATAAFADSPLVKMGRLSVVPLTPAQWKSLLSLSRTKPK